jgi:hypothetical protein
MPIKPRDRAVPYRRSICRLVDDGLRLSIARADGARIHDGEGAHVLQQVLEHVPCFSSTVCSPLLLLRINDHRAENIARKKGRNKEA